MFIPVNSFENNYAPNKLNELCNLTEKRSKGSALWRKKYYDYKSINYKKNIIGRFLRNTIFWEIVPLPISIV